MCVFRLPDRDDLEYIHFSWKHRDHRILLDHDAGSMKPTKCSLRHGAAVLVVCYASGFYSIQPVQ